jgi:arylsulfatase A-like enzyme
VIGKVPLMMYWKGVQPVVMDAQGHNSLALAPTVLHALGVQDAKNYFLGCSLFDTLCKKEGRVGAFNLDFFLSKKDGIYA